MKKKKTHTKTGKPEQFKSTKEVGPRGKTIPCDSKNHKNLIVQRVLQLKFLGLG